MQLSLIKSAVQLKSQYKLLRNQITNSWTPRQANFRLGVGGEGVFHQSVLPSSQDHVIQCNIHFAFNVPDESQSSETSLIDSKVQIRQQSAALQPLWAYRTPMTQQPSSHHCLIFTVQYLTDTHIYFHFTYYLYQYHLYTVILRPLNSLWVDWENKSYLR